MENVSTGKINKQSALELLKILKEKKFAEKKDIAIIGMAVKTSLVSNREEFWDILQKGVDCVRSFPKSRKKDMDEYLCFKQVDEKDIQYTEAAYLEEIDKFDYKFFRLTPREASLMSPNQRILLETVYEAVEDAGYGGNKLIGSKTGVFLGHSDSLRKTYIDLLEEVDPTSLSISIAGNLAAIISGRISYFMDLTGPNILLDTACSSSLISVDLACKSIQNNECEMAIAGGIRLNLLSLTNETKLGIESSDGRTKTFDNGSDGTGIGEGVGVVILKSLDSALKNGDHIYAVIKGAAINQDGDSVGITAPNIESQKNVILKAWENADVEPESISYIEAHGTGTNLGDPIEIEGITSAFLKYTNKKQFCAIGSVKTNIGHLYEGAGIFALIKATLALHKKKLPPSLHFKFPNSKINFANSPVYVNDCLQDWHRDQFPRRCGISAFGLSGTNCHMILEEAPERSIENEIDSPQVLTISAKSFFSLKELLKKYVTFLKNADKAVFKDICFTANTGRGHYNHRVAIIADHFDDLVDKIKFASTHDLENEYLNGVYYGVHKIVSSDRGDSGETYLTERMRRTLTGQGKEKIEHYLNSGKSDKKILQELSKLYIQGAGILWDDLFVDEKRNRLSIPVYPLERLRCWFTIDYSQKLLHESTQVYIHPLLEKNVVESMDQDIYETEFAPEKHFVLSDHIIMDHYVIPGTTYLEMAKQVASQYFAEESVELREISFLTPIILKPSEKKKVQTIVRNKKDHLEFVIASKNSQSSPKEKQWVIHSLGKIYKTEAKMNLVYNLDELMAECTQIKKIDQNELTKGFIKFGPRWLNYHELRISEEFTFGTIQLPVDFSADLDVYYLHPALVDMGVNIVSLTLGEQYLPLSYKSIKIYGPTPREFYSYVKRVDPNKGNTETITFDIKFLDKTGKVFVEIESYIIKKAHTFNKYIRTANPYSKVNWVINEMEESEEKFSNGVTLVLTESGAKANDISRILQEERKDIINVKLGERPFTQLDENNYAISGSEEDYQKLFATLSNIKISQIVHLLSLGVKPVNSSLDDLENELLRGVYSLFRMTKTIVNNYSDILDIVIITESSAEVTGKENLIKPSNGSLYALSKVISNENRNLNCKVLDIDEYVNQKKLMFEMNLGDSHSYVAYRDGIRYVQELAQFDIDAVPTKEVEIKDTGVYIITGGTGGLGLEISKYLAKKNRVNLALINRSKLPAPDQWDDLIEKNEDNRLINRLKKIREIEKAGARVKCFSANITNLEEVKPIIDHLREKYGQINGIIHSAGVAGDGFILKKDENVFKSVLYPKIYGAWILDHLTDADDLDFFIMCSSVAAILGIPGQGDYSAANAFLDSFAVFRSKKGKKTLSINWSAWNETGMAVEHGADIDTVFKTIKNAQAIDAFDEILQKNLHNIIVGEWHFQSEFFDQLNLSLSPEIRKSIESVKKQANYNNFDGERAKVSLIGKADNDYTELEKKIGQIWGETLGYTELNIYDNFYDLGGDSILAFKLINNINKELGLNVSVAEVFNYLSVSDFSDYLKAREKTDTDSSDHQLQLKKAEHQKYYLVSIEQKRLFIISQIAPDNISYNLPGVLVITGQLDLKHFEQSYRRLVARHDSLRTSFELHNGEPVQIIHEDVEIDYEYLDACERDVERLIQETIKPFDISRAPLMRAKLIKIKDDQHLFIFDIHHIVADGSSMAILIKEFFALYQNVNLPDLKIQYKDYSVWQKNLIETDWIRKQEDYWLERFSDEIPVLNLPTDYARPLVQSYEGDVLDFIISNELTSKIKKIAQSRGATVFATLLAIYKVWLFKYSDQEDIVVGTPVAGRLDSDLENIIGMFVNTLPIRTKINGETNFYLLLDEVKEGCKNALENQIYRFENLIEKLGVTRNRSRNPLFDVMFVFQNMKLGVEITQVGVPKIDLQVNDLRITTHQFKHSVSQFDLTLEAVERDGEIKCYFEYCIKLFKKETVERMASHFLNIADQLMEQPDRKLTDIEFLGELEKNHLLYELNNTRGEYEKSLTLQQLFEKQVEKTPDNMAIYANGHQITYRELNRKANHLARLLRNKGVKADDIIAIMVGRSIEMFIGLLGTLKAGGSYLPIDVSYSKERKEYLLQDSQVQILLLQNELKEIQFCGQVIDLFAEQTYTGNPSNLENCIQPNHLAYIIYTSGSTGQPKGVMVEHRNVVAYLNSFYQKFNVTENDIFIQLASFTFDAFVEEVYSVLLRGGQIVSPDKYTIRDIELLVEFININKVTMISCSPLLLNELNKYSDRLQHVHTFISGGDVFKKEHVSNLITMAKVYNTYGPTEATVCATYQLCSANWTSSNLPIGKPITNYRVYIFDKNSRLVPFGKPGELCIAGDGVTRGYLHRPELTKEKFIENPYVKGERLYKTGDLVKWSNGYIEFLGRIDRQVKIRGFRIELEEIENQLLRHVAIQDVIVVDREGDSDHKYLCAYYISEKELPVMSLREHLLKNLSDYMVPAYFVHLVTIPLTPNGKLDRKALPEPVIRTDINYVQPEDDIQEKMAAIWSELLGVDKVGIYDDFFALGGDSIKAIQISSRLKEHNLKLDIQNLFEYPTIAKVSPFVKVGKVESEQGIVEGGVNLTPIQKWYFEEGSDKLNHYNQYVMLKMENLDIELLTKVVSKLVEHHDALRMIFTFDGESVKQYNRGLLDGLFDLRLYDLLGKEDHKQIISQECDLIQTSLDLSKGELVKLALFKTDEKDFLFIVIHHLVVDGISWRIIMEDLEVGYRQAANGQEIVFSSKTTSFKEWSSKLYNCGQSIDFSKEYVYWNAIKSTQVTQLPTDFMINENKIRDSVIQTLQLTKDETDKLLKDIHSSYNTEINDILLSALSLSIKEWTGSEKVLLNLEGHGRENILPEVDVSRTVGWFTTVYPVVLDIQGSFDLSYVIRHIKETLRHIPRKGIGYGVLKYLGHRELKRLKPEISFNYLGEFSYNQLSSNFQVVNELSGLSVHPEQEREYLLDINGVVSDGQLSISFEYNQKQYKEETISRLVANFKENLVKIIEHCMNVDTITCTPTDLGDNELSLEDLDEITSLLEGIEL